MNLEVSGSTVTQLDDGQEKILTEKLIVVINNALIPLSLRLIQADDEYDDQNSYIVLVGLTNVLVTEIDACFNIVFR